jgi:hypothetical protein
VRRQRTGHRNKLPASASATRQAGKTQAKHLLELHDSGNYTQAEHAELFGVGRSTIYRTIDRVRPERPFAHIAPPSPNGQISAPWKSQPTSNAAVSRQIPPF